MEGVSVKELWMLLGEKDVQIYQLLKEIERLTPPPAPPDTEPPAPPKTQRL
jgi:hypothetical protein